MKRPPKNKICRVAPKSCSTATHMFHLNVITHFFLSAPLLMGNLVLLVSAFWPQTGSWPLLLWFFFWGGEARVPCCTRKEEPFISFFSAILMDDPGNHDKSNFFARNLFFASLSGKQKKREQFFLQKLQQLCSMPMPRIFLRESAILGIMQIIVVIVGRGSGSQEHMYMNPGNNRSRAWNC